MAILFYADYRVKYLNENLSQIGWNPNYCLEMGQNHCVDIEVMGKGGKQADACQAYKGELLFMLESGSCFYHRHTFS
jgi:hypothetical protein